MAGSSSMKPIVLAIDGPSGAGKSSTAKTFAIRAQWKYLDTGALYRAITWLALEKNCANPEQLLSEISKNPLVFKTNPADPKMICGGRDINKEIRSEIVTSHVSQWSAYPEIRKYLLEVQRKIISQSFPGIVVEGRDIGSVVAPDAEIKIFLHADISARAARRELELSAESGTSQSVASVSESLEKRDLIDSTRTTSPLKRVDGAIDIDSTHMNLAETVETIWQIAKRQGVFGLPVVAVIGRPNVGKSTLINRMIGSREAIIEDNPGVTRDRVSYEVEWNSRKFVVMDTGGWEVSPEGISVKITAAAEDALNHCDMVLFVVDGQVGAVDEDDALVDLLRRSKKKILLVANKIDNEKDEAYGYALWNLGLGEPRFVSALHGRGSGDLLDVLVSELPEVGQSSRDDGFRRVAIVGRPNVGKSSLLNSLSGTNRALVDDAEGTTRDPIDELIELGGRTLRFIDTAGLRRRAHQVSGTDYYASLRTERAIDSAEVVVMIIDASVTITEQDLRVITKVEESGKALVLALNKWDLVDEDRRTALDKEIDRNLDQVAWAERINISAKSGWHKDRLAPAIEKALHSWEKRVPTAKLNSFLGALVGSNPPPIRGGKQPKILFATQAGIQPPKFVLFTNDFLEASYRRFIERRLREEFDFTGSPVQVSVRVRENN